VGKALVAPDLPSEHDDGVTATLVEDRVEMGVDGFGGDVKFGGNLPARQSKGDEPGDLPFSWT